MKIHTKISLIALFLNLAFVFTANSQISISNIEELSKVKGGTTYIAMKDPNSPKSKEFVEAFKNNWTYSKFEFIKYADIEKHLAPQNSFLTVSGYETSVHLSTLYSNGMKSSGVDYAHTHIFLQLWTVSEKYFKRNKEFKDKDKIEVARVELFTDFPTLMRPQNLYQSDYDADGHIRNWGPGILKNHIQNLMSYLSKGKEKSLYSDIYNQAELKKLNNEVLYVPDYVLIKFSAFTGDESKKHEEKELFEDYKLKYKMLSTKELNDKIASGESFYYLQYIKSSTDKYVSVINAATGEVIYSVYTPTSYNIKSDDLEDLRKKIQKN